MAGKGFLHDPISDIELIRSNLNDRYHDGLPIIKELVQNAEDAKASRIDVGLALGLPNAGHPLLDGPALFAVNNGRFEPDDARNIRGMGLSTKPAQKESIGKFGLGLKSIFHLCEAFFFLSSDEYRDAAGRFPLREGDVLNPWSGGEGQSYHDEWDIFSDAAKDAITGYLAPAFGDDRWFCLWIPLRKRSYSQTVRIDAKYPGDDPEPLSYLHQTDELASQLTAVFPLLRRVHSIRVWLPSGRNRLEQPALSLTLDGPAERRRYPGGRLGYDGARLGGTIMVAGTTERSGRFPFAGREVMLEPAAVADLKRSPAWPSTTVRDARTGALSHVPDRAEPHAAAFFSQTPAVGQARFSVSWAVFLPVGSPLTQPCFGTTDFTLTLHGDYFLDPGRTHIDFGEPPSAVDDPTRAVRVQWNRRLRNDGTLPLVLPALAQFADDAHLTDDSLMHLTDALDRLPLLRDHRAAVCRDVQWCYCLSSEGGQWQLLGANQPILGLPDVPPSHPGLHHKVFPQLGEVCRNHRVVFARQPRISGLGPPDPWPAQLLVRLLDLPVAQVFGDAVQLDYLTAVLEAAGPAVGSDEVQAEITALVRRALAELGPAVLRPHLDSFRRFLALLAVERIIYFALDAVMRTPAERLLPHLANQPGMWAVPMPADFAPQSYRSFGSENNRGPMRLTDAVAILEALAAPPPGLTGPSFERLRTAIALQTIGAFANKEHLRDRCGHLPLFRAYDCGAELESAFTWHALVDVKGLGTLFVQPQQLQAQHARGLPDVLQDSLEHAQVLLIPESVADALFGPGGVQSCSTEACVQILAGRPLLSTSEQRVALVTVLLTALPATPSVTSYGLVRGLRYLLHGQPSHYDDADRLLIGLQASDTTVWDKLIRQALALRGMGWRCLESELSDLVPRLHWDTLGLDLISPARVIDEVREAGPERVVCNELGPDERATLLSEVADLDVLRRLPMHPDRHGVLWSATSPRTYLETDFPVDAAFSGTLRLLVRRVEPELIARQRQLLPEWTPEEALVLALEQPDPAILWQAMLDALEGRRSRGPVREIDPGLSRQLRTTAWLPKRNLTAIRPDTIAWLPGLEDEVARLAARSDGLVVDVDALHPNVQRLASILADDLFLPVDETLEALVLTIHSVDSLSNYVIGPLDVERFNLEAFTNAFRDAPEIMGCIELLQRVADHKNEAFCVEHAVRGLCQPVQAGRLVSILNHLVLRSQGSSQVRRAALDLFDQYLAIARDARDFTAAILPYIRLLNRKGEWIPPAGLCRGIEGVDDAVLLAESHDRLLGRVLASSMLRGTTSALGDPLPGERPLAPPKVEDFDAGASAIEAYFNGWAGHCGEQVIGGFLAVLGDHPRVIALAEGYLRPRSVTATRQLFEWPDLQAGFHVGGATESIAEVMEQQRFTVELLPRLSDGTVSVTNLLGEEILVPLQQRPDSLLVGNLFFSSLGGRINRLLLREIDPRQFSEAELSSLLRESARLVIEKVYRRYDTDIERVWERLLESDVLDIQVSQRLLLNSLLYNMKQLGLHQDQQLRELLFAWDDAQRRVEEAEQVAEARGRRMLKEQAERDALRVRDDLENLLTSDPGTQLLFISAVREKVEHHYQYSANSVPFELFQNADDAVQELEELHGGAGPVAAQVLTFVVEWDGAVTRFFHWGRPINRYRYGSFDGRPLGFDSDLKKMLMLSASDKGVVENGPAVTGKFGMGFKSVFLLADRPRVLSGQLGFEVVGGVFPQRLLGEAYRALEERLRDWASGSRDGTAVELPSRLDIPASTVALAIARFRRFAPALLVFSRKIKTIEFDAGADREVVRWAESPVPGTHHVFAGVLAPASNGGPTTTGLVLRGSEDGRALLLALGPRGAEPLPGSTPTLWVTAPSLEETGAGFAVNGKFELDIGRANLARSSRANDALAGLLGREVGEALCELYLASEEQWSDVAGALRLAADATKYDLWDSLLTVLAAPLVWPAGEEGQSPALQLLRRILWGGEAHGLARLFRDCAALPSRLWGDYRILTAARAVRFVVAGALDSPEIFGVVSRWDSFRQHAPFPSVISQRSLLGLRLDSAGYQQLDLRRVVAWVAGDSQHVAPEVAALLGQVVTNDLLLRLREENVGTVGEYERLRETLSTLQFQAADGSWQIARQLLIAIPGATDNNDESLRAAFAPDSRILAPAYRGVALQFFLTSREAFEATVEQMAEWGRTAHGDVHRVALLHYLLAGELALRVAAQLRPYVAGSWLRDLEHSSLLLQAAPTTDGQLRLLANLGLLRVLPPTAPPPPPPVVNPERALRAIAAWWQDHHEAQLRQYERMYYPDQGSPALTRDWDADRNVPERRRAWFELLLLGASHTLGRTRPEQHRAFLTLCRTRRWTDVFVRSRSEFRAEDWMRLLHDYLDQATDDLPYLRWMSLFSVIFQLSWYLDEYVEGLLAGQHWTTALPLEELLVLRTAQTQQGGGVDAPPLNRTLGRGAHFVLRELVRAGVLDNALLHRYCYLPSASVRNLLTFLGCAGLDDQSERRQHAQLIHDFLASHLGTADATFARAFDIPLWLVAGDRTLQTALVDIAIREDPAITDSED